jgi:hypothetical protein
MAAKHMLMVEGPDDAHVVKHICGQRKIGNIKPYEGKDNLLKAIGPQLKGSDITAIGIMLDADTNLQASWRAIVDRLKKAGYPDVPVDPDKDGTVIESPPNSLLPRVGIWLMPDNKVPGILEDFLRFLVPQEDALWAYAEASIDGLPNPKRFTDLNKPKAIIHTWLAWQEEPGKPFGQAISARYFDPTLPAGDVFAMWLQRVFFRDQQVKTH